MMGYKDPEARRTYERARRAAQREDTGEASYAAYQRWYYQTVTKPRRAAGVVRASSARRADPQRREAQDATLQEALAQYREREQVLRETAGVTEVTQLVGGCEETIRKHIRAGRIPAARLGRQWRVPRAWLAAFVAGTVSVWPPAMDEASWETVYGPHRTRAGRRKDAR